MSLTRQDVEKVALLARLKFDEAELEKITKHMVQIVQYVDKLSELNTEDVEPMAHALDIQNALAEAERIAGLVPTKEHRNSHARHRSGALVPHLERFHLKHESHGASRLPNHALYLGRFAVEVHQHVHRGDC